MNDKSQEDCRMDNERLREIKDKVEMEFNLEDSVLYDELIAAYEVCQQELAGLRSELRAHATMWQERMTGQAKLHNRHAEILRKQLAEAEERDDAMDKIGVADKRTITDLRSQLAASQAEVKRLGYENRVIRAAHDVPNGLSIIVPGAEKDEG